MLSNYILPGERIELQSIERGISNSTLDVSKKVYISKVYEILSEDRIEIMMPMEKTKLILLPVDGEYDVYFYSKSGLYQCFSRIIDRYKRDNVYILVIELTSNLRKFQRREYYRFSCALDMNTRTLVEEEIEGIEKKRNVLVSGLPLKRSIIVDISGGGLRFVASQSYEVDQMIYCKYELVVDGVTKEYDMVGKILNCKEVENRPNEYEHRLQYVNIDVAAREQIIKYIFEEERKHRRRERG